MPPYCGSGWSILRNRRIEKIQDINTLEQLAVAWLPPKKVLVGKPGASEFVTPIEVDELQPTVRNALYRHTRNITLIFLPMALVYLALGVFFSSRTEVLLGMLLLVLSAVFVIDYFISLRTQDGIYQRTLFFYWLRCDSKAKVGLRFFVAFGLVIGLMQVFLTYSIGGLDLLFDAYGALYQNIEEEKWRLITGPFLHLSITHFFVNFVLLTIAGWFAWALIGPFKTMLTFLMGNTIGAFAQYEFGGRLYELYGGVSGGVYALFGLILVVGMVDKSLLPKGLVFLLFGILMVGELSNEVTSDSAATIAHGAGLAVGAIAGLLTLLGGWLDSKTSVG